MWSPRTSLRRSFWLLENSPRKFMSYQEVEPRSRKWDIWYAALRNVSLINVLGKANEPIFTNHILVGQRETGLLWGGLGRSRSNQDISMSKNKNFISLGVNESDLKGNDLSIRKLLPHLRSYAREVNGKLEGAWKTQRLVDSWKNLCAQNISYGRAKLSSFCDDLAFSCYDLERMIVCVWYRTGGVGNTLFNVFT